MTDKKPGLIEAAEGYLYNGGFGRYRFDLELALKSAKKREALVEAVVGGARWVEDGDEDHGHGCDKCSAHEHLNRAIAALDRFDAGEGK